MIARCIGLVMMPLLAGCATVTPGEWRGSRTFIGAVRVDVPVTQGDVQAFRVRMLGLGAGRDGVMLGWQDGQWVIADPARCQMVVIIRSEAEAANAAQVLRQLEGQDICVVNEGQ